MPAPLAAPGVDGEEAAVELATLNAPAPATASATRTLWELTQIRRAVELGLGAKGPEDYAVVEAGAGRTVMRLVLWIFGVGRKERWPPVQLWERLVGIGRLPVDKLTRRLK